jgi:pimeloyl-ACP methyl ester carboxylesterase
MPEPLLLLPGLLCDADLWSDQVRDFSAGRGVMVASMTSAEDVDRLAADILAAAPRHFALAGLSMGGYVAVAIMRAAPDRVTRLALLDTNARPDTDEQRARRRGLIELTRKGRFKGVTPRLLPLLLHPDRLQDGPLVARVTGMAERIGREAFVRQQTMLMNRPDARPDLARIACPTLVLCGRQDALTPLEMSEAMAGAIPGATLAIVEESGHLSTMERPEAVNAHLAEWLER